MDPASISFIAGTAVSLLGPALLQAGKSFAGKANKEIAVEIGKSVGEKVADVFNLVVRKAEQKEAATEAVTDFVAEPDDQTNQVILQRQLEKLMEKDNAFATELDKLLEEAKPEAEKAGITIVVSGSGAAATSGGIAAGKGGVAAGTIQGDVRMGGAEKGEEK